MPLQGGAPTQIAVPLLLTGVEYDPMQPVEDYQEEKWEDTAFYDDMKALGYDIRFFTNLRTVKDIPEGIAGNYEEVKESSIGDTVEFGSLLYKLVNFYLLPQFVKEPFLISTDEMLETINYSNYAYSNNNVQFYKDMKAAGKLKPSCDKAFRLYHMRGVHRPFNSNEELEAVEYGSVTEMQQFTGLMKAMYRYIDEMKQIGAYESSTIIILGDHGRHEINNTESHPAVLIKQPYEKHALAYSSAPIHFRNIYATMAKGIMEDYSSYGPAVDDITDESDVERLHTIDGSIRERNYVDDDWDASNEYCRLIVPYDQDDADSYQVWNPYEINRIDYVPGEKIDFTDKDNKYNADISHRLYKEDGKGAVASNELSICFCINDLKRKDLNFHYTYSNVYNDKQDIRIYANGNKIGTVTCTNENSGIDNILTIPEDVMDDGQLVLRMVFPNAVTPAQLDEDNADTRVLSVEFESMMLE